MLLKVCGCFILLCIYGFVPYWHLKPMYIIVSAIYAILPYAVKVQNFYII